MVEADMVDMETYAVLRACHAPFGVPLIALRGISDGGPNCAMSTTGREYLHVIDEKLAAAVSVLETADCGRLVATVS
jgi:adenosylhomocysteine nucleosidase